ncbi:tripartite motif-containing protein 35-like isoform X2 [Salarias fasciatus]|uniref:tripartite motif-containing protein 35-like isoform X2 n=1 Tax=Salarias fasciatus TaxID=181472 RepID=UPI0011769045|nr:tripartite motif-containing protein 35-like isoform X2 [Salarias fasciatus]XP_029963450.1 tripartite motif-containing protein 35-like isoform X2 [Salarias fasciatus]
MASGAEETPGVPRCPGGGGACDPLKKTPSEPEVGALCSRHSEELVLFCEDRQQLLCVSCRVSEEHGRHTVRDVQEAAGRRRQQLKERLQPLRQRLKRHERLALELDLAAEHLKVQARRTESQIQETFRKLRRFLSEEEEARLAALRAEEEQKSRAVEDKMEALRTETAALEDTVRATEQELRAPDVSFLSSYQAAVQRVQSRPLLDPPRLSSGALIHQAQHLGNLAFNIWEKMKDLVSYCPLILDPNTAHPDLVLSEDLTCLTGGDWQTLPENPERFDPSCSVLSSRGFTSGTHSWQLEVGHSVSWSLGVAVASVQRKDDIWSGFWEVGLHDGKYFEWAPPAPLTVLPVQNRLDRIRMSLDCDEGTLTFSDPETLQHLHTFTLTCTEELLPVVSTEDGVRVSHCHVSVLVDPL